VESMRIILAHAVVLAALVAPGWALEQYEVVIDHGVETRMRDGIVLHADIYRPRADGKFPVLLSRTPYDKGSDRQFAESAAARGYVVILQDVRGRYTSEGEWYPFKHESQDGYDTVEWAAGLPYSNGKVGMFGESYVGATQMLAAIAHPPHLAGIFPGVTASNYHDGWTYQGGAFEQWFSESWTEILAQDTLDRRLREKPGSLKWVSALPLSSFPVLNPGDQRSLAPYFFDWLEHPAYDDFWKQWSVEDHIAQIRVPAYFVGAWYDIFLRGTLRNYLGLKAQMSHDNVAHDVRLLVMVGGHAGDEPKIGELDFGPQSRLKLEDVELHWYDNLLKGIANGAGEEKPVKIFVMGKNTWREEDQWPVDATKYTRFYLASGNPEPGQGVLTLDAVPGDGRDTYSFDPADPVPTVGGPLCCDNNQLAAGPVDQRANESRRDILLYSTPALKDEVEITGPVTAELYVSSSAEDTDFTAKLVDVWPSGFAQNLTEGVLRMRYRNSPEKAQLMKPGEIYKITVDMVATSNVFLAGHKLRLEVSSSNFPRFDRNLNTGEAQGYGVRSVPATNTVFWGREHPSALILPSVKR